MADATSASTDSRSQRLAGFVDFVRQHIRGDEKGEAQIYLDRLFRAFGQPGTKEVGAEYESRVRTPKHKTVGFADLVWKETVLFEMKKRGEPLARHAQQMLDYWIGLAGRRPAYCVLCNFDELWVYDFNKEITAPLDKVTLGDLPERYGPLMFLFPTGESPVFEDDHEAVTRKAADHLAGVFKSLRKRKIDEGMAQRFVLQLLVALFAEDIDLLPRYFVTELLKECRQKPTHSYDLLGGLFSAMNTPGGVHGGRFKGVDYFNGGLFAEPVSIELKPGEIDELHAASKKNWSKVRPEIFGTIFEHTMNDEERHAFGAHFTSQLDIYKIVKPTIVEPWEAAIERAASGPKRVATLQALHYRMQQYRVLDPACGSGNFLYIAYRELKRLEAKLIETLQEQSEAWAQVRGTGSLSYVTARQFYGMDINPFAVELAKVTLMIARKLAIDELAIAEKPLPLANLDANFHAADALITFGDGDPVRTPWPQADAIIGNPPFLGAKRLKPERGADYVNAVRKLYPDVPGMADYCVYWFRRAHDHVEPATKADPLRGRVGLVGTQNVRNNKSREGGLDHVVRSGVIIDAVDNQPWSGEANVHVSIANWVKVQGEPGKVGEKALLLPGERRLWVKAEAKRGGKTRKRKGVRKDKTYELEVRRGEHISSSLSDETDTSAAHKLRANTEPQVVFNGQYPRHAGFRLTPTEAEAMIAANVMNAEVLSPFLVGRTLLTDGKADTWVIDFGARSKLDAASYEQPFAQVRDTVLPHIEALAAKERKSTGKDTGQDQTWLSSWWRHFRHRQDMWDTIGDAKRYICCAEVTKRPIFCFVSCDIRPDKTLEVFAFDDDYSFGVLSSNAHWAWFVAKCSKLKSDFRYTPESVFDTFPWPQSPSRADVLAVAQAGRAIRAIRDEHLPKTKGGLRGLYRTLELPGKNPLKDAHAALDAAVLKAYGFSAKKDLLAQLLELNLAVAAKEKAGEVVTAPGVPTSFVEAGGDAGSLVTEDCVRAV